MLKAWKSPSRGLYIVDRTVFFEFLDVNSIDRDSTFSMLMSQPLHPRYIMAVLLKQTYTVSIIEPSLSKTYNFKKGAYLRKKIVEFFKVFLSTSHVRWIVETFSEFMWSFSDKDRSSDGK